MEKKGLLDEDLHARENEATEIESTVEVIEIENVIEETGMRETEDLDQGIVMMSEDTTIEEVEAVDAETTGGRDMMIEVLADLLEEVEEEEIMLHQLEATEPKKRTTISLAQREDQLHLRTLSLSPNARGPVLHGMLDHLVSNKSHLCKLK